MRERKKLEDVIDALGHCYSENALDDECDKCCYLKDTPASEECIGWLHSDAKYYLEKLSGENFAMRNTPMELHDGYWQNVCEINRRQEEKGRNKYGVPLEENTTLTTEQRIEHLQEELIDALKYCEHLKAAERTNGITANDYQRAALRTAGDDPSKYLLNGVMGLCGEAGEVIDLVKKHLHQGHELDHLKVVDELGDVLWYCALTAEAVGATLSEVMERNIDKLMARYPEGFSKERSVHRGEYDG